jgi:hypothetical protein
MVLQPFLDKSAGQHSAVPRCVWPIRAPLFEAPAVQTIPSYDPPPAGLGQQ